MKILHFVDGLVCRKATFLHYFIGAMFTCGFFKSYWKSPFSVTMSPRSLGPLQRQWHHLRFLHSWGSVETFVSITPSAPLHTPGGSPLIEHQSREKEGKRWWAEIFKRSQTILRCVTSVTVSHRGPHREIMLVKEVFDHSSGWSCWGKLGNFIWKIREIFQKLGKFILRKL